MSNWRDKGYSQRNKNTEDFQKAVMGDGLELAIEWIADNLSVENVFEEKEIVEYVTDNLEPEDVFSDSQLEQWAIDNGYVKSE